MDFSKPYKIESLPSYIPSIKKIVDEKIEMTNDTKNFFKNLKNITEDELIVDYIQQNSKKLGDNLYQKDNFLIIPTHVIEEEVVEPTIRNINAMQIESVPKLTYVFDNTAMQKIFVYDLFRQNIWTI